MAFPAFHLLYTNVYSIYCSDQNLQKYCGERRGNKKKKKKKGTLINELQVAFRLWALDQ